MKFFKNIFIKIIGWFILIIGLFGWLIPIPAVPFFLLFFIGIHILGYDYKLIRLAEKLGFNTEKLEKNLKKITEKRNNKH